MDMAPGEVVAINLPATTASFTGWTAHAEVGAGGEEGESGEEHTDTAAAGSRAASTAVVASSEEATRAKRESTKGEMSIFK